jgi:endoglucanase
MYIIWFWEAALLLRTRFAQAFFIFNIVFVSRGFAQNPPTAPIFEELKRGINLTHWFSAQDGTSIGPSDFQNIKSAHFDHVRITVDPALLLKEPLGPDRINGDEEQKLDTTMGNLKNLSLKAVLVMFPDDHYKCLLNSHYYVGFKDCPQGRSVTDTQKRFIELWTDAARHYSHLFSPSEVYFEILNEPKVEDAGRGEWQDLERRLIIAINQAAPGFTIIATSGGFSGLQDLLQFDPPATPGAKVVYTFHYYWPDQFAQQGKEPVGGYEYRSPARNPSPPLSSLPLETQFQLNEYSLDQWDGVRIQSQISFAKKWAITHRLPVWCGEFGVKKSGKETQSVRSEPTKVDPHWDQMRAEWLGDVRSALDANHIRWAVWDYNTSDFGIATKVTNLDKAGTNSDTEKAATFSASAIKALFPPENP